MTVDRVVHLVAGMMVMISLGLAQFHDPAWMWLTAFVGLNLAQSGITNFCPLSAVLRKSGMREGSCC